MSLLSPPTSQPASVPAGVPEPSGAPFDPAVLARLATELFSALLTMAAVYLAIQFGTTALALFALVLVIFQYLVGELLKSKKRGEDLHRIATTDQRIICYARDGGCTRPNCLEPGYHSEVHHSPDWATGGTTDADTLFFACGPDHKRASDGHYETTVTDTGRLAWTDGTKPPQINHAHHPEELLRGDPDPPDGDEDERPCRRAPVTHSADAPAS